MSQELEISIIVRCETQEEIEKILASVYSGYAAEVVRLSALYGQFPVMGGGVYTPPSAAHSRRDEQPIELTRIEDKVTKKVAVKDKAPKPTGLAGRKRMGRG